MEWRVKEAGKFLEMQNRRPRPSVLHLKIPKFDVLGIARLL